MAKSITKIKTLLNASGRIDYKQAENLLPVHVAVTQYPFHARVLAEMYNLSTAQVYTRLHQHGVHLRDLRNGTCGMGKRIKEQYAAKNVTAKILTAGTITHDNTFLKAKNKNGQTKEQKTA